MADRHESPESVPDPVARAVYRYYESEQLADPNYFENLSIALWEALPSEEREFRRFVLSSFYPQDPTGNARAARAQLIFDYVKQQLDLTKEFDAALEEPRIITAPGQILPIFSAVEYDDGEVRPPAA